MSRLTVYEIDGPVLKHSNGKTCDKVCFSKCSCDGCPIQNGVDKLAAYEDAEEQGRLLMLPCGVGDIAYHIWYEPCHHGETYSDGMGCDGCMDECDIEKAVFEVKFQNVEQIIAHRKEFGSSYFLNREEAEGVLLRGNNDG